jgi:hypothetical protein
MDWDDFPLVLVYSSVMHYINSKVDVDTNLVYYVEEGIQFDAMLYTLGLGKDLVAQNYSSQKIIQEQNMNLLYNNGLSLVAARPGV